MVDKNHQPTVNFSEKIKIEEGFFYSQIQPTPNSSSPKKSSLKIEVMTVPFIRTYEIFWKLLILLVMEVQFNFFPHWPTSCRIR